MLALMASATTPVKQLAGMIEERGSALAVLRELESAAPDRLFDVEEGRVSLDQLENYVHRLSNEGIELLTILDTVYPLNLRMVYDRPAALFVRGALRQEDERSVAVVGTRKATERGLTQAREIAQTLVAADYVVVSGLAAGIDTASHTATLEAGGRTVAVIGTGLRETFPKQNTALQARIGSESAVVSQFWPGQGPRKWTFPARNAVMSGFARATVVVEASHTSGARMQARLANEHGRPVFLLRTLLEHAWARAAAERPSTYVIDDAAEVVATLDRLYATDFSLTL